MLLFPLKGNKFPKMLWDSDEELNGTLQVNKRLVSYSIELCYLNSLCECEVQRSSTSKAGYALEWACQLIA